MTVNAFLEQLEDSPENVAFSDTMDVIEANYRFVPTSFTNGNTENESGQNSGSCKLFAFAQVNNLSKEATLACFGSYYREDVLKNPNGTDHANIRNFMEFGWAGITFEGVALEKKR